MPSLPATSRHPGGTLRAVLRLGAVSLLVGPAASVANYLINRLAGGNHSWELSLPLLLFGLPLGIAAALVRTGSYRLGGPRALWSWTPIAGCACALLAAGAALLAAIGGAFPRHLWVGLPSIGLALPLLVLGFRWQRQGRVLGSRCVILTFGLGAAVILWLTGHPESLLPTAALGYTVGAAFAVLTLALVLDLALRAPLPPAIDLASLLAVGIAAVLLTPDAGRSTCDLDSAATSDAARAQPDAGAPNVILIVLDTVGKHHLSLYGYERSTTPFLEELAKEARVYTRAVSVAPWTLPAHASIFTGLYPRAHGAHLFVDEAPSHVDRQHYNLPDERSTLAEILSARGYHTGAVAANGYWMGRRTNLAQGFDYFCEEWSQTELREGSGVPLLDLLVHQAKIWAPASLAYHWALPTTPANRIVGNALEWIDDVKDKAPFFLLLNFMDAHEPYLAAPEFRDRYPGFQHSMFRVKTMDLWTMLLREGRSLTEAERNHLVSQYDGSLMYLDSQLRRFVQELADRGLLDHTLLIVTADHGEALGAHDMVGHQALSFETSEIPLLIRYPGGARTGLEERRFENRQLFHLILEEAGYGPIPDARAWEAVAEQHPTRPAQVDEVPALQRMLHTERAVYFDALVYRESDDGRRSLYDLGSDPREEHDLASARPAESTRGHELLAQFLAQVPDGAPSHMAPATALSAEERERLRALGYTQ